MLQKNKRFTPHLLAIETGTTVDFPNLDPIFHSAFSNFDGTIFDLGLYPPGTSRTVQFDRAGIVRVFCNIHPSMSAVIVVVNSPYIGITDHNGHYSLPNVPAGNYRIRFFDEAATPEALDQLTRKITVNHEMEALGYVQISEAGYIPTTAHKNKYGHDYPPDADDAAPGYSSLLK